ncbi:MULTISPECIES: hypothetical protein [Nostocales]|uniref:Uncharacterized protein n=2 Tax=Nostocales TaxID=1161 RepID=A0A0C1QYA6_9CYAN|nr:hypothetical protein [Tolypothrix bouteillei]KAF3886502.1 hypothetical protein DA73_0400014195 [Tolypothrix bouteillei VB521301]
MPVDDLKLREAQPSDRPHLLIWDTPNDSELRRLVYRENADLISYRDHLLNRIDTSKPFLTLHLWLERELDAIKAMCANTSKPVVLLKDLDCLITYLHVRSNSPITLFWQNLFYTRHLQSILWILLPSQLTPSNWDDSRMLHI